MNLTFKSINHAVRNMLLEMESVSAPRGLNVVEEFMTTIAIDPKLCIMDFRSRPFNWKYFAGELWWYLSKETSIEKISNFSGFWKGLTSSDGTINSNYGYIMCSRDGKNQFDWALNRLISDSNTRQAIMVFNTPDYQYDGVKDYVCTMYVNFWIRDSKLNMKVQMRSNDLFYGLQYDAPFFSIVHQSMAISLRSSGIDVELGNYYHSSDNTHYYEKHFDIVENIKKEEPDWEHTEINLSASVFDANLQNSGTEEFCNDMEYFVSNGLAREMSSQDFKDILFKYIFA